MHHKNVGTGINDDDILIIGNDEIMLVRKTHPVRQLAHDDAQ